MSCIREGLGDLVPALVAAIEVAAIVFLEVFLQAGRHLCTVFFWHHARVERNGIAARGGEVADNLLIDKAHAAVGLRLGVVEPSFVQGLDQLLLHCPVGSRIFGFIQGLRHLLRLLKGREEVAHGDEHAVGFCVETVTQRLGDVVLRVIAPLVEGKLGRRHDELRVGVEAVVIGLAHELHPARALGVVQIKLEEALRGLVVAFEFPPIAVIQVVLPKQVHRGCFGDRILDPLKVVLGPLRPRADHGLAFLRHDRSQIQKHLLKGPCEIVIVDHELRRPGEEEG